MLERELYFYHINYINDNYTITNKLIKKRHNENSCMNRQNNSQDHLYGSDFIFDTISPDHKIKFYSGRTPSLLELKKKIILNENDFMYISTFSLQKIIKFFDDFSIIKHNKPHTNNIRSFFEFCIKNNHELHDDFLLNKITSIISKYSYAAEGELPPPHKYCKNERHNTKYLYNIQ